MSLPVYSFIHTFFDVKIKFLLKPNRMYRTIIKNITITMINKDWITGIDFSTIKIN